MKNLAYAVSVVLLLVSASAESRADIVVTDVRIMSWENGQEIVAPSVGDLFRIDIEVLNTGPTWDIDLLEAGGETVNVLSLYHWSFSPENRVTFKQGDPGFVCMAYRALGPGDSAWLSPFCRVHAFEAQEAGPVSMDISVGDWMGNNVCQDTFEFTIVPEPGTIFLLGAGLAGMVIPCRRRK